MQEVSTRVLRSSNSHVGNSNARNSKVGDEQIVSEQIVNEQMVGEQMVSEQLFNQNNDKTLSCLHQTEVTDAKMEYLRVSAMTIG